jgi:transcriptional regulator
MPFLLDETRGEHGTLRGHMARPNPHWQALSPDEECLVIFQGPHAYISPNWYESERAVPTWNYTTVHVYGYGSLLDDPQTVRQLLEKTVNTFEASFPEPWTTGRLPEDYIANMARGIVAFEIPIVRMEGKRKLGQNRPAEDVRSAAAGLRAYGDANGLEVAELMSSTLSTF